MWRNTPADQASRAGMMGSAMAVRIPAGDSHEDSGYIGMFDIVR
jgi:hypothetical protein